MAHDNVDNILDDLFLLYLDAELKCDPLAPSSSGIVPRVITIQSLLWPVEDDDDPPTSPRDYF